jgi:ribose 5-phosphate isomerase B
MLYIAADHAGFTLKNRIIKLCKSHQILVTDVHPQYDQQDDYPDVAEILAKKLFENDDDLGIALCGTAEGIGMALNRFSFVRAATVDTPHLTKMAREHNHATVICLPGPYSHKEFSDKQLLEIIETFLYTIPDESDRHIRRIAKLSRLPVTFS